MPTIGEAQAAINRKIAQGLQPSAQELAALRDAQQKSSGSQAYGLTSSKFSGVLPQPVSSTSTGALGQDEHVPHSDHVHPVGTHTHADTTTGGGVDHAALSNLNSASYTHLTATQATDLTDTGDSTLHYHATDRALDNATVTSAASAAFNEAVADAVGGMVTGNTETGIAVTYDDADNTLDFVVSAVGGDVTGPAGATADDIAIYNGATGKIIKDSGKKTSDFLGTAVPVPVANGGTGVSSWTDGQLLIGNNTGNTATLATLTEGEAIDVTNGHASITIGCELATSANKGVATFNTDNFTVTSGDVTIKDKGVALAEIANIAENRLLGKAGGISGSPEALTVADGEGIDTSYTEAGAFFNIAIETATSSNVGGAKFNTDNFTVTAGDVIIKDKGVVYAEIQDVTATDKILGRSSAGAGVVQEIDCTATGRSILDDASTAAVLVTIGAMPLQPAADIVINESGGDFDMRWESDTNATMFGMNSGANTMAVGAAPVASSANDGVLQVTITGAVPAITGYGDTAGGGSLISQNSVAEGTGSGGRVLVRSAFIPSAGDKLIGSFRASAYRTGTTFADSATIEIFSSEAWAAGAVGSYVQIVAAPPGSTTRAIILKLTPVTATSELITVLDDTGLVVGSTAGLKIGTATSQKVAFHNATPVVQAAHIADPAGGVVIDTQARTAINAILVALENKGILALS